MQALQHSPPDAVVALQSRLAALYPDYDILHMPVGKLFNYAPSVIHANEFQVYHTSVHDSYALYSILNVMECTTHSRGGSGRLGLRSLADDLMS